MTTVISKHHCRLGYRRWQQQWLTLIGVASVVQTLITGVLVILAVALDQMSRKGVR